MSVRKRPNLGEIINVIRGHKVIEVSESLVTIEVTRFKGIEPAGAGRMDIPMDYLKYCEDLDIFLLKKEYLDWFDKERQKLGC